jgi:hypothetical protein
VFPQAVHFLVGKRKRTGLDKLAESEKLHTNLHLLQQFWPFVLCKPFKLLMQDHGKPQNAIARQEGGRLLVRITTVRLNEGRARATMKGCLQARTEKRLTERGAS